MDLLLRAPRPPLGFSPNASSSALPPPIMPNNATLASAGPLGLLQPLMTQLLAAADESSFSSSTYIGGLGALSLTLMLLFFVGPGIRLPCSAEWEFHCCKHGLPSLETDTCEGGNAPERFTPENAINPGSQMRDGGERGLVLLTIVLGTFGLVLLFALLVHAFLQSSNLGRGILDEKSYVHVAVFALCLGTALWSYQAQVSTLETIKELGCQPADGWSCKLGKQTCVLKRMPCDGGRGDTRLFPGVMWTSLATPSTYSSTLPTSDARSTIADPTGGLTGARGGVVAPGVVNTPFGVLNRPDKADESLETYIYRRINPDHFAQLDREKAVLFEEKKRRQVAERARRGESLPYTPLFSAGDPRSWAQESHRTDSPQPYETDG